MQMRKAVVVWNLFAGALWGTLGVVYVAGHGVRGATLLAAMCVAVALSRVAAAVSIARQKRWSLPLGHAIALVFAASVLASPRLRPAAYGVSLGLLLIFAESCTLAATTWIRRRA